MTKRVPEIRFEGFTDEWEQRKLGEITESYSGGTPSAGNKIYYGGNIPFIRSGEINDDKTELFITEEGLKNSSAKMVSKGDILYALYGATSGEVGISKINGAINQAILAIKPKEDDNSYLIIQWLKKQKDSILATYLQGGQGNLSGSIVKELTLQLPIDKNEQKQIGAFFKSLDDTIALHQCKLEQLQSIKDGFLQKLFPKDGEKEPEIRFLGFADDWEQRKLGEVSDVRDGTHASPKYVNQGHPMVTSKNLTSSGLDMTDVSFLTDEDFNEINKRSKVSIGDILFGMIGTIGNPVIVDRADFAIKNVALIKEKSYNPITNKWLLQYLKSPSFNRFIQKENAGGTQKFIALGLIRDMILKVPGLEEQQKIGTFLEQIDNTITLHQRELELLKQSKKAFLQKMFV